MSATVQDVLERAAQILERDGWDPRTPGARGARGCMVGAIASAMDEVCGLDGPIREVLAEVRARAGVTNLTGWGLEPGRTLSEVLALLRIPGHCECEMDGDQRRYCAACRAREEAS